jgi:hypothetical protein
MPFFQSAVNTEASKGTFNDVAGDQTNTTSHNNINNQNSNNVNRTENTNSNNDSSTNQSIGEPRLFNPKIPRLTLFPSGFEAGASGYVRA